MKITVAGIGPGGLEEMTPRARAAIEKAQVVAGYRLYLDLIEALLPGKVLIGNGMRGEVDRCRAALEQALAGRDVCIVSSGDAGVYGMAGLVLELAEPYPELEVEVVPGVTAATAAAAVLGAPLGHDFAVISLSDLLTDWRVIERRIRAAGEGDFNLCFYNPASCGRRNTLQRACGILLEYRAPQTPCGWVRNAGRWEETHGITTLEELADFPADMLTTVIVGSSRTRLSGGRLVTPRGYLLEGL